MEKEGYNTTSNKSKIERDQAAYKTTVQNIPACSTVVDLADDAWLYVLSYLDAADKMRASRVCKRWGQLARVSWKSVTKLSFDNMINQFGPRKGCRSSLTNDDLEGFLRLCGTGLRCLDFVFLPHSFTARVLDLIVQYSTSLQELRLYHIPLNKTALMRLGEKLPRLRSLTLNMNCNISDTEQEMGLGLETLQTLQHLCVAGNTWLTGEFFRYSPKSLKSVDLWTCENLKDQGIAFLAQRCPNLTRIEINDCPKFTGQLIIDLAEKCRNITQFMVTWPWHETNDAVSTSSLLAVAKLPLLEDLEMSGYTGVTDEVLRALSKHCPLLRSIRCCACENVSDEAISHLSSCLQLESLDLSYCPRITDRGLRHVRSAPFKLKAVILPGCRTITDEGVHHVLSTQHGLLELDITYCKRVTARGLLSMLEWRLQTMQHPNPLKIKYWNNFADPIKKELENKLGRNVQFN